MSPASLARKAGYSRSTISYMMNDPRYTPRFRTVVDVAEALGADAGWLCFGSMVPERWQGDEPLPCICEEI